MFNKKRLTIPDEHIYQFLQHSRRDQLLWITGMTAGFAGLFVALKMLTMGADKTLLTGPIVFSALAILLVAIKNGLPLNIAASSLLAVCLLAIAARCLIDGGLYNPLLAAAPLVPLLAIVIHGPRASLICGFACILMISGLTYQEFALQPFGIESHRLLGPLHPLLMASFLIILTVMSTVLVSHQASINDAMAATIWNHASHDHLTGLANRRHLDTTLLRDLQIARRDQQFIAVMLIDVDEFKRYNDANGHLRGDGCLCMIADTLKEGIHRPSDTVGRFGGEEFLVIMPNTDEAGARLVAENLRAAVEDLDIRNTGIDANQANDRVTISIGVCCLAASGVEHELDLIDRADKALYIAKQNGRNRVEVSAAMTPSRTETYPHTDISVIGKTAS